MTQVLFIIFAIVMVYLPSVGVAMVVRPHLRRDAQIVRGGLAVLFSFCLDVIGFAVAYALHPEWFPSIQSVPWWAIYIIAYILTNTILIGIIAAGVNGVPKRRR